jgi:hypothetical protein
VRIHHDAVHLPAVVAALAEHALEHAAQGRLPGVWAIEEVVIGRVLGEAGEKAVDVSPVERLREPLDQVHAGFRTAAPSTSIRIL